LEDFREHAIAVMERMRADLDAGRSRKQELPHIIAARDAADTDDFNLGMQELPELSDLSQGNREHPFAACPSKSDRDYRLTIRPAHHRRT
jgi:hypothetical protein